MSAKRICVTGSRGFLGKALCAELAARHLTPVHFDHPQDVRDKRAIAKAVLGVDGVINLAGVLGTAETIGAEHEAADVNILGALNVMDCSIDFPLVQIATGHEGQLNPYAITKHCATELALSRARWTQQKIAVVRAYHVYGPGQKMCAPHGHSKVRKIIPSFIARALTGMPLEINGDGHQLIDLVYVEDVAKVLADALQGPYGEITEAGTGQSSSVLQTARDVLEAIPQSKSLIEHVEMRKGEPEGAVVIAIDPKCYRVWPFMLEETIQWYREELGRTVRFVAA